jgi:hypothetical protein
MKLNISIHWTSFVFFVVLFTMLSIPAHAQQCTLPSQIFLPQPDKDRYKQFGSAVRVDGDYMVVGVPQNSSSQAMGGIAFVYKLDAANQWIKIAELTPSDLGKYTGFGRRVAIDYRTEIPWWIFAITCLSAILITLLTVSHQSIKAAMMSPVNSLRS